MNAVGIFNQRLVDLRSKRNLSKAEMARLLGFSPQRYQRYEEDRTPDTITVALIAEKLNVSVDWLLGRDVANAGCGITQVREDKPIWDCRTKQGEPLVKIDISLIPDDGLQGTFDRAVNAHDIEAAGHLGAEIARRAAKKEGQETP